MRTITFVAAAAMSLACDDPDVASKAASILEHGGVDAQIRCLFEADFPGYGTDVPFIYSAYRFIDGSVSVRSEKHNLQQFWSRDDSQAQSNKLIFYVGSGTWEITAEGGYVELAASTEYSYAGESFDIETYCTGFNLEAFGVE